ncbi:hypothetical protein [Gorillibacterium sp. CAU 1737]|uniref:hypothetical protein n=1 Tax=Gorillibacterium sp. CAU 1737 TaxID=3140362 RepID=UPI0032609C30
MQDESVLAPSTAMWNEAADITLFGIPIHLDSVIHGLVLFGLAFIAMFFFMQGSRSTRKLHVESSWPRMVRAMLEQELDREVAVAAPGRTKQPEDATLVFFVTRSEEQEVIRLIREIDGDAVITVEASGFSSRE